MALTTRNVFTPSGQGYFTPDGRPLAGIEVKFTLVATGTTRPVSPFDATSGARVAPVTTAITDAAGEFSINLWPNDRGANTSTEYICHIGNGYSDFRAALPSSATPIEWLDFQALGTPLTPAEVSALATHIADTTVHLVPNLTNALKIPRITEDGTSVEYVVGGGGGSGDVVGPASATDNAIVRYDGTTGKLVQDSAATIADTTGDITAGKYNTVTITGSGTPSLTVTGATAVSGTNTGDQTNISGNAATVTTNANMTGDVTSVGNATSIAAGVIVDADINASADIAVSKLAAVTASRALTSDVDGKVSASATTSTELGYLSGVTSAVQTQFSNKIGTALTSGQMLVGNVSNVATAVTPTGDVTISNAGVTAIAAGVIVDADINASADIAVSKLAAVTASRALTSDVSGKVSASSVTSTELGYLSGVTSAVQTQIGARELTANKGAVSGYCPLDSNAKVATTYLPDSILGALKYQGTWNASTNSPAIPAAGAGNLGHFYVVSVAGVTNIDGIADWEIGDWIVSNGTAWGKVDNSDKVSSIYGRTGAVTAQSGDYNTSQVTENTNLYYTDARARGSLTVTFTGSSGSGTYNSGTGALNIPTYTLAGLGGQPLDATLTALAGVTTSADQAIYATGADTFGTTSLTTFGRSLIDDVDAAAARTTLGAEAAIASGTISQYWRGDKTWQGFSAAVRVSPLAGLSTATNAVISDTDTVLSSFGKLQKQVSDNLSTLSGHTSATTGIHGATSANTASTLVQRGASGEVAVGAVTSNADTFRLTTSKTPTSPSASGNTGDLAWDADYLHLSRATNTWERFRNETLEDTAYPSVTAASTHKEWARLVQRRALLNRNRAWSVVAYAHGATAVTGAYAGGVYSPTQNRIYLVPRDQASQTNWHYIDCATGNVVAYAHGITAVAGAYIGGAYSPIQNRIYFVPFAQANQTNWHYLDCATGSVVAYAHGATAVANAYIGGVYSPTQNRIYFVPFAQANQTNWHYLDCATGSVVAYAHGATTVANAYIGGVYSPTQNRIYLVPYAQANQTNWHYIDCATGNVVAYAHGITALASGCVGGAYSPTQNRIYLVPYAQANQTNWHYIDCATGNVVAYAHGITAVANAYIGGVYSPTQNRVYFVPYAQSNQTNWHYIDCATGAVVSYAHGATAVASAYYGGVYSPTQNRIYLVPRDQANWHYITHDTLDYLDKSFFGSSAISSTL